MQVVVVQQPSTTASVNVPLAVPPTVQVYAIRTPIAADANATSFVPAQANGLSPRHMAALSAFSASTGVGTGACGGGAVRSESGETVNSLINEYLEDFPNGKQLLNVMIGVVTVDGVLTKGGILGNAYAVTTNGNLTFSQLTFQFGLSDYAFLQCAPSHK
jgi:hypothetical protein